MSEIVGYVVVEYNQASGQPLVREDVWHDRDDAVDVMEQAREENRKIGRRERYAVGTITIEDDE
jgi:hypothetical protein